MAGTANEELEGPQQGARLEQLEAEHDDLRAALSHSLKKGDAEAAETLMRQHIQHVRGIWARP